MVTIPTRSNLVISATIISQYIASGVIGVVLTRCLTTSLIAQFTGALLFPFCYFVGRKIWVGIGVISELKNKGLRGAVSESTEAIRKVVRVAQGESDPESLPQDYLRPGGFALLIFYPGVGAIYGAILAVFVDPQAIGTITASFCMAGLLLGVTVYWLVRRGFIDLMFSLEDDDIFESTNTPKRKSDFK